MQMQNGATADGQPDLLNAPLLPPFNVGGTHAAAIRRRTWRTRFLPEHMYEYYARQNATTLTSLPAGHLRYREIPPEFIDVWPLDKALLAEDTGTGQPSAHTTGSFGRVTSVFKVISAEDGCAYALRRVDNVRSVQKTLDEAIQFWGQAVHPAVIPLRHAFHPTATRGGPLPNALFFLHDYYPGAKSLRELYLDTWGPAIEEHTLWSYICQLVAGLRAVHDANLSFRGLRPAHILVTGQGRLRFGSAGVMDVLESDVPKVLSEMKALDIMSLGQLILHLAVRDRTAHYPANIATSLETVKRAYSASVVQLIIVLLGKQTGSIHEVCRLLAPQLVAELDGAWDHNDAMEHLLAREADNGRILRLLLKLGFINERPEYEGDPSWAETGDRYLLRLFRDFVFHQTSDDGRPMLDVAHVLDSLHSLDVGSPARVLLSSRDGASVLVSSYSTLRTAVDGAFSDLKSASRKTDAAAAADEADVGGPDGDMPPWMRRPKIPAVVRARTSSALRTRGRMGMAGMARGGMGGMMGMGGMGMGGMMPNFGSMMAGAAAAGMPFGMMGGADGQGQGVEGGQEDGVYYTGEGDGSGPGEGGQGGADETGQPMGEGYGYAYGQQAQGYGLNGYDAAGGSQGEGYTYASSALEAAADAAGFYPASAGQEMQAQGQGQGAAFEGYDEQAVLDDGSAAGAAAFNVHAQEFRPTWASK